MSNLKLICVISVGAIFLAAACGGEQNNETAAPAPTPAPASENNTADAEVGAPARGLTEAFDEMDASCDQALAKTTLTQCRVCHSFDAGKPNLTGPNLFGIYGASAAAGDNFAYSPVLRESGLVWDEDTLNKFLENPPQFLPGNRMAYGGVRDAEARKSLICLLKALK